MLIAAESEGAAAERAEHDMHAYRVHEAQELAGVRAPSAAAAEHPQPARAAAEAL
jgi:hypothetical protein